MHKENDSPKLLSVGSGRVWFMGHLLYWLSPLCSEIKASPLAQHVVRICIQHFIIKDYSARWHPKCWSLVLSDVSLNRETVTFALFMCLVFGMLILNIFFPPSWHMAALIQVLPYTSWQRPSVTRSTFLLVPINKSFNECFLDKGFRSHLVKITSQK